MKKHLGREEISIISEVDSVIALADAQPPCVVGNESASLAYGHEPCTHSAVWAFRTHDGMGESHTGACPSIALVCDHHLSQLRDSAEHNIAHARRKGMMLHCTVCHSNIRQLEDLFWGIERIRS